MPGIPMIHFFHDWQIIATNKRLEMDCDIPNGAELIKQGYGKQSTTILYRCEICGQVKSSLIRGHWTIEELRKESK